MFCFALLLGSSLVLPHLYIIHYAHHRCTSPCTELFDFTLCFLYSFFLIYFVSGFEFALLFRTWLWISFTDSYLAVPEEWSKGGVASCTCHLMHVLGLTKLAPSVGCTHTYTRALTATWTLMKETYKTKDSCQGGDLKTGGHQLSVCLPRTAAVVEGMGGVRGEGHCASVPHLWKQHQLITTWNTTYYTSTS